MSLHHLAIMTKPSLSCLLCFLCMLAIPIFPFLRFEICKISKDLTKSYSSLILMSINFHRIQRDHVRFSLRESYLMEPTKNHARCLGSLQQFYPEEYKFFCDHTRFLNNQSYMFSTNLVPWQFLCQPSLLLLGTTSNRHLNSANHFNLSAIWHLTMPAV